MTYLLIKNNNNITYLSVKTTFNAQYFLKAWIAYEALRFI